jgi:hypothetical protein
MQSYFVNNWQIKLDLLVLTLYSLILQQYLLLKNQIAIKHLIVQAICLYWRNILIIVSRLMINLEVIHANIWENLFESAEIESSSLYISLKLLDVIYNIWALRLDLFLWNNVGDKIFVLEPFLNLVFWITIGSIVTN